MNVIVTSPNGELPGSSVKHKSSRTKATTRRIVVSPTQAADLCNQMSVEMDDVKKIIPK